MAPSGSRRQIRSESVAETGIFRCDGKLDWRTGRVKLGRMTTRRIGIILLVLLVTLTAEGGMAADNGLKPWSANTHPTDVKRSHVEEITTGQHSYKVIQAGTMDGRNGRSPMGCG